MKFQKNIDSATTRLKSMEAQQGRAKSAMEAQQSGLAKLQSEYKTLTKASSAYVGRLTAEGNKASATVAKYNGVKKSLSNLKEQYKAQTTELERVANESGKTSTAYQKQKVKLDETGKSVAETRSKMKSMNSTMNKLQPTGINKIDHAVVKVKDNTGKMATKAKASFAKFRTAAMAASVGVAALGASLLSGAKQASALQNAYVANANLMSTAGEKQADVQKAVNNMQKDGKKYSIEYGESQKVIADGYQELIKRGYSSNQALGSMKSILQASKASGDSFNDTMQVTTSTMEAFGMKSNNTATQMKNTSKVANTLAMAADATSTNFSDLGVGMSYVGTSAKQAGLSLNDTASAMGVLSNSGIEADKAGTGLRKTINSLISPTKTGTDALGKYGMSISDFKDKSGNLKSVGTIFKEIGDKVPKGDQANFFHNVFGTTGQNAAAVLAQNVDQLDKVNKQVGGAYQNDYVGKLANKNMKSTQNSTKQFKEAFKAIQIELGTALMPALSKAAKGMAKAFETKKIFKRV
ncbi:phage tail tape measure protein [Paucilactobacillus hokkaidonensis]|uniref:phage tail tape measure protein n=1 Tax=Paucilactobacillus hokkaidonensis TaxID=1193095 RepID=UPI0006CF9F3F|nr:phage tail tape measure protein [Paucilactobacillus hokkaidonensis]